MRLTRTFNAGHDNLYLNKDDINRLLKGQMLKESSLIVQMENPEREWIGLTQEEFEKLINDAGFTRSDLLMMGACVEEIVYLVEANLKKKNT